MNKNTQKTMKSIEKLRLPELQARFAEIVGEASRSPNKKFLLRRITEALEVRDREAAVVEETAPGPERVRLTKLSVPELQARYREVVGRDTGSTDSAYLVWKIRQAEKGRIRVGPLERRVDDGVPRDVKVLPLRMTAAEIEQLDAAWKRLGFKSRTEMIRVAVGQYLSGVTDLVPVAR